MGIPRKPGCSFAYIWGLIKKNENMILPTGITPELVVAIFWEETFFNNVFQTDGTAIGYGQAEPFEFYRFNANNINGRNKQFADMARIAQAKGYAVFNLPPIIYFKDSKGNSRAKSSAPLSDDQAVQVSLALIRDMRERGKGAHSILDGYAGVGFQGEQAAHLARPGGREAIIQDWHECEKRLKAAILANDADGIMAALKFARPFNQDDEFRRILFPA